MESKYDKIRPFYDTEVNEALLSVIDDPMLQGIMRFTFPELSDEEWKTKIRLLQSTDEFQKNIIYQALEKVLAISSEGLSVSGFEKLDKTAAYLFISNHRDIILDTSLLNFALCDYGAQLTASAIGDNLVKKPFLYTLSKVNRNFLVLRNLAPRELLDASVVLSEYIHMMLTEKKRSVWIAQKEGRTKDGNDSTHPGVLKMLTLAAEKGENLATFFKKIKIVPVSISYEYDPTDALKIPELIAKINNEPYIKSENEDFNTLYNGIIGYKKRIHIHAGEILDHELDAMEEQTNGNKQVKILTQIIDNEVIKNYKLWPTNYIAYDLLYHTNQYEANYTTEEKEKFVKRLHEKIGDKDKVVTNQFLAMYANPVVNKEPFL
jgi:1-acyl-sn-glycerol-3-phosphate acyltransferase